MYSFIPHFKNKSTYYVPGSVLGTEICNKREKFQISWRIYSSEGIKRTEYEENKQGNMMTTEWADAIEDGRCFPFGWAEGSSVSE